MHHQILLRGYKISVYVKNCKTCKESNKICLGRTSRLCIDCLRRKEDNRVPGFLEGFTSKRILNRIRKKKIQEYKVLGKLSKKVKEKI